MSSRILAALVCWSSLATAQASPASSAVVPQLVATATADVELKPDRATLVFAVESRGATAAAAGTETARKQQAVLGALRALGVAPELMTTIGLDIHPEYAYPGENKPPRVTGYVAQNSVRIEVRNLDQTGVLIDAALSKEATGISSLQFTSSKLDEARRQALESAVTKAKADADAMARAAGGSLGALLEIIAQPSYERPISFDQGAVRMTAVTQAVATTALPGFLHVSATVSARWGYVPGR